VGSGRLTGLRGHVKVDEAMRDAWIRSMATALDGAGLEPEVRGWFDGRFAEVATFLMNA
jgi:truncated hemoglobin YjbI